MNLIKLLSVLCGLWQIFGLGLIIKYGINSPRVLVFNCIIIAGFAAIVNAFIIQNPLAIIAGFCGAGVNVIVVYKRFF